MDEGILFVLGSLLAAYFARYVWHQRRNLLYRATGKFDDAAKLHRTTIPTLTKAAEEEDKRFRRELEAAPDDEELVTPIGSLLDKKDAEGRAKKLDLEGKRNDASASICFAFALILAIVCIALFSRGLMLVYTSMTS